MRYLGYVIRRVQLFAFGSGNSRSSNVVRKNVRNGGGSGHDLHREHSALRRTLLRAHHGKRFRHRPREQSNVRKRAPKFTKTELPPQIVAVDYAYVLEETCSKLGLKNATEVFLEDSQILIPGLVDAHVHAPQYPNAGLGYDRSLLEWLQDYTFPLESKYYDTEFAGKVYDAIVVSLTHL